MKRKLEIIALILTILLVSNASATLESAVFGFGKSMSLNYISSQNPVLGKTISFALCAQCAITSEALGAISEIDPELAKGLQIGLDPGAAIKQEILGQVYQQLDPKEQQILANIQKFEPYIKEAFRENPQADEGQEKATIEIDDNKNTIIKDSEGNVFARIPQGFDVIESEEAFILVNKEAKEDAVLEIKDYKIKAGKEAKVSFSEKEGITLINLDGNGDINAAGTQLNNIKDATIRLDEDKQVEYAEFTSLKKETYEFTYNNENFVFTTNADSYVRFDPKTKQLSGKNIDLNYKNQQINALKIDATWDENNLKEIKLSANGVYKDLENNLEYSSEEDFNVYLDGRDVLQEKNAISVLKEGPRVQLDAKGKIKVSNGITYQGLSEDVYTRYRTWDNVFDVKYGDALIDNGMHQVYFKDGRTYLSTENLAKEGEAESFTFRYIPNDADEKEIYYHNVNEESGTLELLAIKEGAETTTTLYSLDDYTAKIQANLQEEGILTYNLEDLKQQQIVAIAEIQKQIDEGISKGIDVSELIEKRNELELDKTITEANIKISEGDYDAAIQEFGVFAREHKGKDMAYKTQLYIAETYKKWDKSDKAESVYKSILGATPEEKREKDRQLQDVEKEIEKYKYELDIQEANLKEITSINGRTPTEEELSAIAENWGMPKLRTTISELEEQKQRLQDSINNLVQEKASEISPEVYRKANLELARLYIKKNEPEKAEQYAYDAFQDDFKEAVENPENTQAFLVLATANQDQGKLGKANEAYNTVLKHIDPKSAIAKGISSQRDANENKLTYYKDILTNRKDQLEHLIKASEDIKAETCGKKFWSMTNIITMGQGSDFPCPEDITLTKLQLQHREISQSLSNMKQGGNLGDSPLTLEEKRWWAYEEDPELYKLKAFEEMGDELTQEDVVKINEEVIGKYLEQKDPQTAKNYLDLLKNTYISTEVVIDGKEQSINKVNGEDSFSAILSKTYNAEILDAYDLQGVYEESIKGTSLDTKRFRQELYAEIERLEKVRKENPYYTEFDVISDDIQSTARKEKIKTLSLIPIQAVSSLADSPTTYLFMFGGGAVTSTIAKSAKFANIMQSATKTGRILRGTQKVLQAVYKPAEKLRNIRFIGTPLSIGVEEVLLEAPIEYGASLIHPALGNIGYLMSYSHSALDVVEQAVKQGIDIKFTKSIVKTSTGEILPVLETPDVDILRGRKGINLVKGGATYEVGEKKFFIKNIAADMPTSVKRDSVEAVIDLDDLESMTSSHVKSINENNPSELFFNPRSILASMDDYIEVPQPKNTLSFGKDEFFEFSRPTKLNADAKFKTGEKNIQIISQPKFKEEGADAFKISDDYGGIEMMGYIKKSEVVSREQLTYSLDGVLYPKEGKILSIISDNDDEVLEMQVQILLNRRPYTKLREGYIEGLDKIIHKKTLEGLALEKGLGIDSINLIRNGEFNKLDRVNKELIFEELFKKSDWEYIGTKKNAVPTSVFEERAIKSGYGGGVLHNHPSGVPKPSALDLGSKTEGKVGVIITKDKAYTWIVDQETIGEREYFDEISKEMSDSMLREIFPSGINVPSKAHIVNSFDESNFLQTE